MGSTCCVIKRETIPEEFIISIYESLKIQNYSFEEIFETVIKKDCTEKNIQNLYEEKINYSSLKMLMEENFYDLRNEENNFYQIQKIIFEELNKYFTKINDEITLPDYFSILLYFVNNSDEEKCKIFFYIHFNRINNDAKSFRTVLLNYMKDILFLLSNIIIHSSNLYESQDSLTYHLSSFSVEKVENFFNKHLHKDITNLQSKDELKLDRIYHILMNISFIFNFYKIREIFLFFFNCDKINNYSIDEIQNQLKNYLISRKQNLSI